MGHEDISHSTCRPKLPRNTCSRRKCVEESGSGSCSNAEDGVSLVMLARSREAAKLGGRCATCATLIYGIALDEDVLDSCLRSIVKMGWTDNRRKAEMLPAHQLNQAELIPCRSQPCGGCAAASRASHPQPPTSCLRSTCLPSRTRQYNELSF